MNQAEKEAAAFVTEAVNYQISSDLGLRINLAKNEIMETAMETQEIVHDIISEYNVPMVATVNISLQVNSVNLNRHVQELVNAHIKKLKLPDNEALEMY